MIQIPLRPYTIGGKSFCPPSLVLEFGPMTMKASKLKVQPERVSQILERLEESYPEVETALRHENPLQLLVATILSAQCTDARVNLVTPGLFGRFPDALAFSRAPLRQLESATS